MEKTNINTYIIYILYDDYDVGILVWSPLLNEENDAGAKKVLDIGVFTGASSLAAALALPEVQRWEFIKENKKVRKKEKKKEKNSAKKVIKKKRKCFLFFGRFPGRVHVFLFSYFLLFFYKFPPQFSPKVRHICIIFFASLLPLWADPAFQNRIGRPWLRRMFGKAPLSWTPDTFRQQGKLQTNNNTRYS